MHADSFLPKTKSDISIETDLNQPDLQKAASQPKSPFDKNKRSSLLQVATSPKSSKDLTDKLDNFERAVTNASAADSLETEKVGGLPWFLLKLLMPY